MRPGSFGWLVGGQLTGSGRPIEHEGLDWLWQQGIRAILLACYLVCQSWKAEAAMAEVCNRRPGSIASQE